MAFLHNAKNDLRLGMKNHKIWFRLAQNNILDRYHRSKLGVVWISLTMVIMVITFGILYGKLFNRELTTHVPYVAIGLAIWIFYSEMIVKGCQVFIVNRRIIQQIPLALSTYLFQHTARELIILAHHLLVVIGVFIIVSYPISTSILMAIPALVLVILNAFAVVMIVATLSTRYRDLVEVVTAVLRPMMFITPIIWNVDLVPARAIYVIYNPLYHLIEIIRAPVLGQATPLFSWMFTLGFTFVMVLVAITIFNKNKDKIVYWL